MKSFKGQLTLWISGVVAIALVGLGAAMSAANIKQLEANLDQDIRTRAESVARGGNRPPPPGGPGPFGQGPGPQGRPDDNDPFVAIRRPRIIPTNPAEFQGERKDDPFDRATFERASKGAHLYSNVSFNGTPVRVFSTPIFRDGRIDGVVQVARETGELAQMRQVQIRTLLLTLPFALLAAVGVAFFLTDRVVRPISQMSVAAKAIADGDFSARLPTQGLDEFANLGTQFNQMASKVEESVAGLEASLERQRQFTADASHELRTPLTRLQLATSAGLNGSEEPHEALKVADQAAKDMGVLVGQLLDLAKSDTNRLDRLFKSVDLRVIVAEALEKSTASPVSSLELGDSPAIVRGSQEQLERACLNLLENTQKHATGSEVKVRIFQSDQRQCIEIRDQGPGVSEEHLPKLTERFYRVDSARARDSGGSGLGLAIVDEIVRAHRGQLTIESAPGKGVSVTMCFPSDQPIESP